MPFQQQMTIVSVLTTLLVFSIYFYLLSGYHADGAFAGPDATIVASRLLLWLIAASIAANIALQIVSSIVIAILRNDPNPNMVADERDRIFELRGMQVTAIVTGIGFVLSIIAVNLGVAAWLALNFIMVGFALGDMAGNLFRLYLYRRGF